MTRPTETTLAGVTVGDLIEQLRIFPADADLSLSGLRFSRLKMRAPNVVQLEFREQVYRDSNGTLHVEDFKLRL